MAMGFPDLAVLESGDDAIAIFLGDGSGGYHLASTVTSAGNNIFSIAVGDFNQDGKIDIVASNFNVMTVTTVQGNGDGTFSPGVTVKTGFLTEAVAVADFDGDGIPDIAVAFQPGGSTIGGGGYVTLKGAGDGTFNPPHGASSLYNSGDSAYIFALTPETSTVMELVISLFLTQTEISI